MKKLIFIDNDQERDFQNSEEFHIRMSLEEYFNINWEDVERVHAFWHKCRDEGMDSQYKLLFEGNHAIITYSMYTSSHFGSLFSFLHFLKVAGSCGVKGVPYLNLSSEDYMLEALEYAKDEPQSHNVLKAVTNNFLVSYNHDLDSLTKVVVDLTEPTRLFKTVPITMAELDNILGR